MSEQEEAQALDAEAWERRAIECRAAVERLAWLAGSWRGHGSHGGVARVCEVETRLLFDGSFLESRERIYTSAGVVEHEDLTVYGASPEDGPGALWATSFIAGGLAVSYRVTVSDTSVTCDPEGLGVRLAIDRTADGYRVRIFYPDDTGAWAENAVVDYTPRG
jgi:hypothetical protein